MARIRMVSGDSEYLADPLQVPHLENAGWRVADGEDDSTVERWPMDLRKYEGQPEVELYSPTTGNYYKSPESAVPYHRARGWVVVGSDDYLAAQTAQAAEDLSDRTVEELRELAKERGISPLPTKKAELLDALSTQEQEQQQDAGDQPADQESEE